MKTRTFMVSIALVFLGASAGTALSASKRPTTLAELAMYQGPDRQQILEEGAKKEGKLVLYTTHTFRAPIIELFKKKYPFITVEDWRSQASGLLSRVFEEYKSGRNMVDVIAGSQAAKIVLQEAGMLQPFYSTQLPYIEEDAITNAPGSGVLAVGHYQNGLGLGYHKRLIKKEDLPKSYEDLLDPKWKGKSAIVGSESGMTWMGAILAVHGEAFVRKLAAQEFKVHMVSGQAMNDIIVAGEYAWSPTIPDSSAGRTIERGAPVDWIPLEPVASVLGQIMLPKTSIHPHAALLYIDLDLSREAGEIYKSGTYNSPRKDVAATRNYKKYYGNQSSAEVNKLHDLFARLFLKR